MYFTIFDTETTGLTSKDEVIQLSALLVRETTEEEKNARRLAGKKVSNLSLMKFYEYYCDTQQTIEPKAQQVHGIDKALLHEKSGGKTFEDIFIPFTKNVKNDIVQDNHSSGTTNCRVAHNSAFDKRLVNQTLQHNGLPAFDFGKEIALIRDEARDTNFCLMKGVMSVGDGKRRKLMEVLGQIYSEETVKKSFSLFANNCNLDPEMSFHNASYDIFCTYLVLEHYFNKLRG